MMHMPRHTALKITLQELSKLPIAIKTESQKMRKRELEAKVESLEKNMEKLQRPRTIWVRHEVCL